MPDDTTGDTIQPLAFDRPAATGAPIGGDAGTEPRTPPGLEVLETIAPAPVSEARRAYIGRLEALHRALGLLPYSLVRRFDVLAGSDPRYAEAWEALMRTWHTIDATTERE